jgi:3-(3-hydroxy-phenyl)propionate hydroxylase
MLLIYLSVTGGGMYFTPRHYAYQPLTAGHHEVVVVGAGPVGLATALGLARRGIRVTVLEDGDSVCEGSRAICLSRHSLEVLDRLGVGDVISGEAVPWTTGRSFFAGTEVLEFRMPYTAGDPHPPMVNISQAAVEQHLVDAALATPGCDVAWEHHVRFVADDGGFVTLTVATPDGEREITADWVVAADGARSIVRQCLGLRLSGTSYSGQYLIADIHWESPLPAERLLWFDPPVSPGETVILHRQPDDIWRFDCQLPTSADPSAELGTDKVRARVATHLDWLGNTAPWTLEWSSVYYARALSLDSYVEGRVVFAGDSAHMVPIFGVRGLNSGLEDAETLAWTLALVLRAGAAARLLDVYSAERQDAWRQNIAQADLSTLFMSPGTHGYRRTRDAVLALAAASRGSPRPDLRELINPRQTSATHARTSPLTMTEAAGDRDGDRLVPGDPVPDVLIGVACGGTSGLHVQRGNGFTLLSFGDPGRLEVEAKALSDRLSPAVGARALDAPDAAAALGAEAGEIFVIRPDGLLLGRFTDPGELDGLADRVLSGHAPSGAGTTGAFPVLGGGLSAAAFTAAFTAEPDDGGSYPASPRRAGLNPAENMWRQLSEALNATSEAEHEPFLTRLALLLALEHPDPSRLSGLITEAQDPAAK